MKAPGRAQPLILVVDQEQAILDQVSAVLAEAGFACHRCLTAEAAGAAPMLLPELIIADVHLQGLSGMELCERLQQNEALAGSAGDVPFRRPDSRHHSPLRRPPGELLFPQAVRSPGARRS